MLKQAHALCCIKAAIEEAIKDGDNLTVNLDRDDCYDCSELFRDKCAVNILVDNDSTDRKKRLLDDPEKKKSLSSDQICVYNSAIDMRIEVYALRCEGSHCKAATVSGWVNSQLHKTKASDLHVNRVTYSGSSHNTTTQGDNEFTVIVMRFTLDYLFSPEKPWLLTSCLR